MSKWKCENPNCKKPCYAEPPERCYPTGCLLSRNNTPDWREEDEPTTKCSQSVTESNQLPKLTAEVFNRPDCPAWAKYAAVDESGIAYYYAEEPCARKHAFGSWDSMKIIDGTFDASDWKNSLIERPVKKKTLPDWCKVGEWVYFAKEDGGGYYSMVTKFDGEEVIGECPDRAISYCTHLEKLRQARLRPFNAEEMRWLVGKVIATKEDIALVVGYRGCQNKVVIGMTENHGYFSAEKLLEYNATIDGKPCGVLEHLENGEWVE